jgi:hypothetical protein
MADKSGSTEHYPVGPQKHVLLPCGVSVLRLRP